MLALAAMPTYLPDLAACACTSRFTRGASTTGRSSTTMGWSQRGVHQRRGKGTMRTRATSRLDPFADPVTQRDLDARLPDLDWTAEVPVTTGKFAGYTLLASAFTDEEVEAVADLLLGSGMAGFPLERRTLLVYLRGAVPAFPYGTYLVGRLRAPLQGKGKKEDTTSMVSDSIPIASSWSEEKAIAHGPIVATVGVSFNEKTRRKFSSLSPPSDAAYLSDLTVFEQERGEGLGAAMLQAAELFTVQMQSPSLWLHVATKKPGVVKLYKNAGYQVKALDPGIFGWRGRLLMRKLM